MAALLAPCASAGAHPRCSNSNPRACIVYAAGVYHQPVEDALRVAWCESSDDPYAVNRESGDVGLWQFEAATWAGTPYRRHSVFSARWSSLGAMWYWSRGEQSRWSCW
jgi:soluble lytic murein transglycosylase-like protein